MCEMALKTATTPIVSYKKPDSDDTEAAASGLILAEAASRKSCQDQQELIGETTSKVTEKKKYYSNNSRTEESVSTLLILQEEDHLSSSLTLDNDDENNNAIRDSGDDIQEEIESKSSLSTSSNCSKDSGNYDETSSSCLSGSSSLSSSDSSDSSSDSSKPDIISPKNNDQQQSLTKCLSPPSLSSSTASNPESVVGGVVKQLITTTTSKLLDGIDTVKTVENKQQQQHQNRAQNDNSNNHAHFSFIKCNKSYQSTFHYKTVAANKYYSNKSYFNQHLTSSPSNNHLYHSNQHTIYYHQEPQHQLTSGQQHNNQTAIQLHPPASHNHYQFAPIPVAFATYPSLATARNSTLGPTLHSVDAIPHHTSALTHPRYVGPHPHNHQQQRQTTLINNSSSKSTTEQQIISTSSQIASQQQQEHRPINQHIYNGNGIICAIPNLFSMPIHATSARQTSSNKIEPTIEDHHCKQQQQRKQLPLTAQRHPNGNFYQRSIATTTNPPPSQPALISEPLQHQQYYFKQAINHCYSMPVVSHALDLHQMHYITTNGHTYQGLIPVDQNQMFALQPAPVPMSMTLPASTATNCHIIATHIPVGATPVYHHPPGFNSHPTLQQQYQRHPSGHHHHLYTEHHQRDCSQPTVANAPRSHSHHIHHHQHQQKVRYNTTKAIDTTMGDYTSNTTDDLTMCCSTDHLSSLLQVLPITAQPSHIKQAYGMGKVWLEEFESLFKQFLPDRWILQEVEDRPTKQSFDHQNDIRHHVQSINQKFKIFVDSAKVRFCCDNCGHGWTSMKGRVIFWYELFELTNLMQDGNENKDDELSESNVDVDNDDETNIDEMTNENEENIDGLEQDDHKPEKNTEEKRVDSGVEDGTVNEIVDDVVELNDKGTVRDSKKRQVGYCAYKLFGQQCDHCDQTDKFERSMWYPEEVGKVLNNFYNRIGQLYYGFETPAIDKQRRAGRPKTSHNGALCQACHDGVCADRK